jgi:hypothetical protein
LKPHGQDLEVEDGSIQVANDGGVWGVGVLGVLVLVVGLGLPTYRYPVYICVTIVHTSIYFIRGNVLFCLNSVSKAVYCCKCNGVFNDLAILFPSGASW